MLTYEEVKRNLETKNQTEKSSLMINEFGNIITSPNNNVITKDIYKGDDEVTKLLNEFCIDVYVDKSPKILLSTGEYINPKKNALYNSNGEFLSFMSNHYNLIQNRDILMPILDNMQEIGYTIHKKHTVITPKRSTLHLSFPELSIKDGDSENYVSTFITNSFDGSTRVKVEFGLIRAVCTNGMIVRSKELSSINFLHNNKFDINSIKEAIEVATEQVPVFKQKVELMQIKKATTELFNKAINIVGLRGAEFAIRAMSLMQVDPQTIDVWNLYQILTFYVSRTEKQRMIFLQKQLSKTFNF